MAATVAGAIAWNVNAADQRRDRSLAELGVEVLSTPDGLEAIAGSRFKSQRPTWKADNAPSRQAAGSPVRARPLQDGSRERPARPLKGR